MTTVEKGGAMQRERNATKEDYASSGVIRRHMVLLLILVALLSVPPVLALAQPNLNGPQFIAPSVCATSTVIGNENGVIHIRLQNSCVFPVHWIMQCGFGASMCFGTAEFFLDAGERKTVTIQSPYVIDGPYHVNS
jgi:hypothetical protein